jgi:prepilin-type processing-associated H-X9-DG protein
MDRQVKSDGLTRLEALVVVLVVVFIVGGIFSILWPGMARERRIDIAIRCGSNLAGIGKAMLTYAADYNGAFPVAGGRGTRWGDVLLDWSGQDRSGAFGLDPNGAGGEATVGSSLYLLVRGRYITPEEFVCPVDRGTREFSPLLYGLRDKGFADLWDSGPEPGRHVSYAYHVPYGAYPLTTASEPGLAVAADRNPWIDSPFAKARDFSKFKPDIAPHRGTTDQACCGNSPSHRQSGQNVLFIDGHVQMQRRAFCSIEDDNIYTVSGRPGGDPWGTPPRLGSQPANRKDSLLVNDAPALQR